MISRKKISRRHFCRTGLSGAAGFTVPGMLPFTGALSIPGMLSAPGLLNSCGNSSDPLPPSGGITARVAAVKGIDLYKITLEALEAIGGIEMIVHEGETVFIKPNFVNLPWAPYNQCFRMGECTKTEIILAVAEECLRAGARKVTIGEGSHLPTFDWKYAVTLDGERNLVSERERLNGSYPGTVELACLETESPGWHEVRSHTSHGKIAISSLAAEADRVISIPVAKTHSWAQLTLSAKNFLGITPLSRYAQLIDNTWWNRGSFDHRTPEAISQVFLDITKALKPDLAIVDFSIGLEGDGPTRDNGGRPVDMRKRTGSWALLASTDLMAADATAARIMNHRVERISQLKMGFAMGLGEIREGSIELAGEKIGNLQSDWKPARLKG